MARGHPDYAKSVGYAKEGVLLQEYSIPPVWWMDDFSEPQSKWEEIEGTVALKTVATMSGNTLSPLTSANMLYCTTAAGGDFSLNRKIGSFPHNSNVGFEINFAIGKYQDFEDIENSLIVIYASVSVLPYDYELAITYNPRDGNWYYLKDSECNYALISNHWVEDGSWCYVKLLINPITKEYLQLQINNKVYDLSGIPYPLFSTADYDYCQFMIYGSSAAGKQIEVVFDHYVITYGES